MAIPSASAVLGDDSHAEFKDRSDLPGKQINDVVAWVAFRGGGQPRNIIDMGLFIQRDDFGWGSGSTGLLKEGFGKNGNVLGGTKHSGSFWLST